MSRAGLRIGLLVLAVFWSACQSETERRDGHLARAEAAFEQRDFAEATIELRNALKLDPESPEINFRIAEVFRYQDRLKDAIFFYRETIRLDPSRTDAAVHEASLLIFDEPERARELLDEVQAKEPGMALAYVVRSRLALVESEVDEALRHALTAAELDPKDSAAHLQVAKVHQARIRRLLLEEQTPDDAVYEAGLAALGRVVEVGDDFRRAEAQALRAALLATWPGHATEAGEAWARVVELTRDVQFMAFVRSALGRAERYGVQHGHLELAEAALEERVSRFPGDGNAWVRLAGLEIQQGGTGDESMRGMIQAIPSSADAYMRYADFLQRRERDDDALKILHEGLESDASPPALLSSLVTVLRSADRPEEAEPYLSRLESEYPEHRRTVVLRAQQLISDGELVEARSVLEGLIDREEHAQPLMLLARIEQKTGNNRRAIALIERALDATLPGQPVLPALRMRARLEARTNNCQGALRTYSMVVRRGEELVPADRVLQASCLYATGRDRIGRGLLKKIIAGENPPVTAIAEFVAREYETNPAEARRVLETGLSVRPRNPLLLERMVTLDLLEDRPRDALTRLNAAFEAGVVAPTLVMLRARSLAALGDLAAAESDALQAFQANPSLIQASTLLLAIYRAQGRTQEAVSSFEEALAAGALGPPAIALLAQIHMQAGNDARARELLEQVIGQRSDLPGPKNDLAYILAQEGEDLDRALRLAQEAQQALDDSPSVSHTLGYVYLRKGLLEPALEQLRYTIELAERNESQQAVYQLHLGEALRGLDRSDEAREAFQAAVALDADNAAAAAAIRELDAAASAESAPGPAS